MNDDVLLYQQLDKALPPSVANRVAWVHQQVYRKEILVCFIARPGGENHIVPIPKDQWLSAVAIARLCLECP